MSTRSDRPHVLALPGDSLAEAVVARGGFHWLSEDEFTRASVEWQLEPRHIPADRASLRAGATRRQIESLLIRQLWFGGVASTADVEGAVERHCALTALLERSPHIVVNRPSLTRPPLALYRAPALAGAVSDGMTLQRSLLTADADRARRFVAGLEHGAFAARLGVPGVLPVQGDVSRDELALLVRAGPVVLVERFRARALRLFVVGDRIVAERTTRRWDPVDSRATRLADGYERAEPDPALVATAVQVARRLGMTFCGLLLAERDDPVLCTVTALPSIDRSAATTSSCVVGAVIDMMSDPAA